METKRHTNALSSQLIQMNHWYRPSAVLVTASVHELFLKVSTHPAKLTWLGSLSKPDFFRTKKEGGKTSNMLLDKWGFQLGKARAGWRPKDYRNPLLDRRDPTSLGHLPPSLARQSSASVPSGQLEHNVHELHRKILWQHYIFQASPK